MSETCVTPQMRAALSRHVLEEGIASDANPCVRIFRMYVPGTRYMSVDLIFAAGRIWISGDLRITDDRGLVSDLGYGLDWFAGRNGEDYLAQKFLRKRHVPELAVARVKDDAARFFEDRFVDGEEPTEKARQQKAALEEAAKAGASGPCGTAHELWELYGDLEIDTSDGVPGWGYDPREVGRLAAVQQRFAELYAPDRSTAIRHCPSCVCGRRAPVQGSSTRGAGTISWPEHEEAWAAYAGRNGRNQTAERIAERGGFGWVELCELLGREPKTWAIRGAVAERERS